MDSLQALRIEEAGSVAEDHPAVAREGRNRPPAAVGQRLGAIADHFAAFEKAGHERMPLEFLQHALRVKPWVGIVESDDEAERDDIIFAAVNPSAAVFFCGQRPAYGVDDLARGDAAGGDFPQLLDALAVGLRVAIAIQRKARDELLGERAASSLSEDHDFGLQIVAGFEVRLGLILLVHALVIGADTGYPVTIFVAVEEEFGARESPENRDAGFFHLGPQPLYKPVERDNVVAVIAQWWRRDGEFESAFLGQEIDGFFGNFGIQRRFLLESRKKFAHGARIEQCAGKAVLADLAGLFEDVNILLAELRVGVFRFVLIDELREPQGAGHASGAAADNDHIG